MCTCSRRPGSATRDRGRAEVSFSSGTDFSIEDRVSRLLETILRLVLRLEHRLMLWLKHRRQARPQVGRVYDCIILEMKSGAAILRIA